MANPRTLNRSFAGGELSQDMYGRIDDAKYQSGASLLRNFIATPQGPAENRAGFQFVRATKNNGVARLIPFVFSPEQTMIVELGAGYFRFHTNAATLIYSTAGMAAWTAPSGAISISRATPAVVTWAAHGLTTGQSIRFYLTGGAVLADLPTGLQTGYTYTVVVVDANTFTLLDNGSQVNISATAGAGVDYVGVGSTAVTAEAAPGEVVNDTSVVLTGLASAAVTGGIAQVTVTIGTDFYLNSGVGGGDVLYQYNVGSGWVTFHTVHSTRDLSTVETISVPVTMADVSLLQLRVVASVTSTLFDSVQAHGEIDTWKVNAPTVGVTAFTGVKAYRQYVTGDMVSYGGSSYIALVDNNGGLTTPGTDATVWSLLPASLIYEVPNSYAEADLFSIHYAQSADVMTLVHPNYPPAELRRLSATVWTFSNIAFGQAVASPATVTATPSPGYKVTISSGTGTYTTAANHTLAYTDPVYITGGTGFCLVSDVPLDGSGNPIKNQLTLVDYDGNAITASLTGQTIQFGSKIIDITNYYVVTALAADSINESSVSTAASALCNLNVTGSYNTIAWSAVAAAARYRIYKRKNGLYGFIGETTALTFSDNNIAPDFSITPPIFDAVYNATGDYPGAVSYFDQRRCFGGTTNHPQDVTMTKTGTESDVSYSIPVKDTDRLAFRIASREACKILHIVELNALILLTSSTEFRVSPASGEALTPSNISSKAQSYVGASTVQPHIINNSMVYCAARGGHVREMGYSWQSNGFVTGDLSLRSKHLFDNLTIADQAYTKCPIPIVWFVSSDGKLLGLTYVPEEQIGAWHQHTTDGYFESIAAVPEGNEDRLYAVIRRTIGGVTKRYIERMASRLIDEDHIEDCFFVDSGLTFNGDNFVLNGPSTTETITLSLETGTTWDGGSILRLTRTGGVYSMTDVGTVFIFTNADGTIIRITITSWLSGTVVLGIPDREVDVSLRNVATLNWAWAPRIISGLDHLEGKTVAILGDGSVMPQQAVSGGQITLPHAAQVVQVGLPIALTDLGTLPLAMQIDGFGQGRAKNIDKVWIKVTKSSGFFAGPDTDHLTEYKQRTTEPYGTPPALLDGEFEIMLTPSWQDSGQLYIRQSAPLPLTIVGITMQVSVGG